MRLLAKDRISILYCERGRLEVDGFALILRQGDQCTHLPVGATNSIFVAPGTVVTHAAVKLCAEEGTLLVWVGEDGIRTYAAGNPGGSHAEKLLFQASLKLDPSKQLAVAKRMYEKMFGATLQGRSIDQLRGEEGSRVKEMYKRTAIEVGLPSWSGRNTESGNDPANQAISFANAALYGLTEAVVLAMGFSPALGFIHTGAPRSFVYDVADCIKLKTTVPLAMSLAAESTADISSRIKRACRELFSKEKIPCQIAETIEEVLLWPAS